MHPIIVLIARVLLGVVWLTAGITKFLHNVSLKSHFQEFGLPPIAALCVARLLPWVELALGTLLLLGKSTSIAAGISAILLCLFGIAIIVNLAQGRTVECHCFGQLSRGNISWFAVSRNLLFIAAALLVRQSSFYAFSLDRWGRNQLPPGFVPLDLIPILLITIAGLLAITLSASAWQTAQIVVQAEDGPAADMPERLYLRRWLPVRFAASFNEKRK